MRSSPIRHWSRGGLTALVGLAAGATIAAAQGGMAAPEEAIVKVRNSYIEAFNAKNGAAVAKLYADDAILVDSDGKMVRGRAELDEYFANRPMWPHLVVTPGKVHVEGTIAWETGLTKSHITTDEGKTQEIPGHYLVVLELENGAWRIQALSVANHSESMMPHDMMKKDAKDKPSKM